MEENGFGSERTLHRGIQAKSPGPGSFWVIDKKLLEQFCEFLQKKLLTPVSSATDNREGPSSRQGSSQLAEAALAFLLLPCVLEIFSR